MKDLESIAGLVILAGLAWAKSQDLQEVHPVITDPDYPPVYERLELLDGLTVEMQQAVYSWLQETPELLARWSVETGQTYSLMFTAGARSQAEQQALYAQGRTAPGGIVTHRDGITRRSRHQDGQALDFVLRVDGTSVWEDEARYLALGELAERHGLTWGGRWSSPHDPYHLELPDLGEDLWS